MSSKPGTARGPNATVLHVPIECNAEVALPSQSGKRAQPGKRSRAIGLAVAGSRATHSAFIAVGPELPSTVSLATTQLSAAASASCYPLSSLHQIHAKPELLAKGRLTIEVRLGSTVHTVFVKDAKPSALAQLYRALKAGRERAKGSDGLSGAAGLELLREFFPQQAKAAAAAARPTEEGLPQPVKGHVRLMMVAEAVGSTPGQAGRRAADALMRGLGLRLAPGSKGGRAEEGGYSASLLAPAEEAGAGKPAPPKGASAKPVVTLRTAQCAHHKLSAPCWVEADIDTERLSPPRELGATPAAAVEALLARAIAPEAAKPLHTVCVLPHRSVLERLPGGLTCHLRSGDLPGGIFCTRFELRNADEPPSAPPLGRCDVRYFEPRSMLAGPIAMSLRMSKEACKGWASAKAGRDLGVLGTTLVERVEVFCTRLVASRTGELRGSSALLVAGWLPELTVAPFVRRDYKFHGDPDESMGSKFLKTAPPHRSQPEKKRRIDEVAAGGAAPEITKLGTPFGARSEPAASPHTSTLGDGQSRRKTEGAEAAAWASADNIEELGTLGKISSSALDTSETLPSHFPATSQPLPSHFPATSQPLPQFARAGGVFSLRR